MAKTLDAAGVKRLIQEIKGANKNLNTPIPISTENTPESMAQNVKNIADYVEKVKAAGVANVDGMGVTCLINGGISGLGYIYVTGNSFDLIGMTMWDDMVDNAFFMVSGGKFNSRKIAFEGTVDTVTSDMLVEGARKPIILTPSTTEVDEETYQKLLSDDVDVVFKDDTNFRIISLTSKIVNDIDEFLRLEFCQAIQDSETFNDACFIQVDVSIKKSLPHTTTISNNTYFLTESLDNSGYLNKSNLLPVLQEIDLRGTDADRKAKLDQFETDWKALTGASDLTGARFVGRFGITDDVERNVTGIMTYSAGDAAYDATDNCFYGICNGYSMSEQKSQIAVKVSCTDGSLTITPLFSHLEAITIKTGNTPEDKAANVAAIKAYVDNLIALGVDITKGYMIPFYKYNTNAYGVLVGNGTTPRLQGYLNGDNTAYAFVVGKDGMVSEAFIQLRVDVDLTTNSKQVVGAINEVNSTSVTNRADLDRTMSQVASPDDRALPLLCGQPPILFGAGTPKEAIVPDNWNQYDPETGEGYNWNGKPSAIGQQYVDTTAASGGRYIAVRNGEWDLKWINC